MNKNPTMDELEINRITRQVMDRISGMKRSATARFVCNAVDDTYERWVKEKVAENCEMILAKGISEDEYVEITADWLLVTAAEVYIRWARG